MSEEYFERDSLRFWSKVRFTPSCWIWTGHFHRGGYGMFNIYRDGKSLNRRAHRVAYALAGRTIEPGQVLDHACRNRACVNPDHLRPLSNRENVLIGIGPSAINARKTHCPRNHPYDAENTRINRKGARECRTCERERLRRRRRKSAA